MSYNHYWNLSGRFINKITIFKVIHHTFWSYKAPSSLSYFWNFGSLAIICLLSQIITGIFLAMHYVPSVSDAFNSVEHIMRDVNYGWFLRYLHANGASMFFIVVYTHVFRGLYYGSYVYPRSGVWNIGIIILLIMILTAFMGYVLPWGQMSFWAATVITNLASAIPFIGETIVYWLWGGYSVSAPTLNRFFSFHYLFPFLIVGLVFVHIILLHEVKSNNPIGVQTPDVVSFTPYYTVKDAFGLFLFFIFAAIFVFYFPNYLGHTDNYIKANSMSTPTHIVPEWYFLPFYAILRSVPNKLGGVLMLLASILIFLVLPVLGKFVVRSTEFRFFYKFLFWFFLFNCFILGWIGGEIMEEPFLTIGRFSTIFYFFFIIILIPFSTYLENLLWIKKK